MVKDLLDCGPQCQHAVSQEQSSGSPFPVYPLHSPVLQPPPHHKGTWSLEAQHHLCTRQPLGTGTHDKLSHCRRTTPRPHPLSSRPRSSHHQDHRIAIDIIPPSPEPSSLLSLRLSS
eukprot:TRINITY_DN710_c0_g1_i2.p1 TRINITY_DN710_c0_g1~~TRINITY_DN710_c0_g1_i2.p1  ORF type:complete len:117 (-),score=10.85 TRINITY_DN710_c0_g1_i2:116-466(-)